MGTLFWTVWVGFKGHHTDPSKREAEGDVTQTEEGKADRRGGGDVTTGSEVVVMWLQVG